MQEIQWDQLEDARPMLAEAALQEEAHAQLWHTSNGQ
jgi:hypothetical protein